MKIFNNIRPVLLILFLMSSKALWAIAGPNPFFETIVDRKWDLKQMYINKLPVDSFKVADMDMSLIFNSQGKFFQLAYVASLNAKGAIEGTYSVLKNSIRVGQAEVWYDFQIEYLGENHLVLVFTQLDPKTSLTNTIEYRLVADNSVGH